MRSNAIASGFHVVPAEPGDANPGTGGDSVTNVRFPATGTPDRRPSSSGRTARAFGRSKINLHRAGHEFEPKAHRPTPGRADLCLIADGPLEQVIEDLAEHGVPIEEGPVERAGATGPIRSVYFHDPT